MKQGLYQITPSDNSQFNWIVLKNLNEEYMHLIQTKSVSFVFVKKKKVLLAVCRRP